MEKQVAVDMGLWTWESEGFLKQFLSKIYCYFVCD